MFRAVVTATLGADEVEDAAQVFGLHLTQTVARSWQEPRLLMAAFTTLTTPSTRRRHCRRLRDEQHRAGVKDT